MKNILRTNTYLRQKILPIVLLSGFGLGLFLVGYAAGDGRLSFVGDKLSPQNQGLPADLNYSSVERLYDALRENYDGKLDENILLDGLKTGMASAAGDSYTEYLNSEDAKAFNDQLAGSFTGIGAELGTNDDKDIIVVSPLSGYPAEKAGLKPQDIIAGIDGKTTVGMTISKAVRQIRGPAGTKVTLTIIRGRAEPLEIIITRQKITIASVEYKIENQVGYLKINQFASDTPGLVKQAAQDFKKREVKGVVVDVRGNPGGYLNSAVDVANLWLDKGEIIAQENRGGKIIKTERATGDNILKGMHTIILIDGGSASASEILAGALRDNKAATVLGTKSFGKGSIQRVEELPGGAELKVTVARWLTPSGKSIDKKGIEPDIRVENKNSGGDAQKDRAIQIISG